jgi:hypothetical protein
MSITTLIKTIQDIMRKDVGDVIIAPTGNIIACSQLSLKPNNIELSNHRINHSKQERAVKETKIGRALPSS